MRTSKSKAAAASVDFKNIPADKPVHADTESMDFNTLLAASGFAIPNWKRTLVAFVASFCAGYFVGSAFVLIIEILMAATIAVTGSAFLALCVYIMGFALAIYASFKLGQKIGMYIVSGDIDADLVAAKNKVSGWFKRAPAPTLQAA